MTTATRRLRRAGVAGLATIATVGGLVLATGGTAFAAELAGAAASSANPTVYPGSTANPVGDLTLSITNVRSVGDTLLVQLAGAGAPGCATTGGAVGFSGTPTVAVSGPFTTALGSTAGTDTDDVKPTFTVATQSSAGACTVAGVKDQLLITVTNSAANAGDFYTFTVSGQKVDVGSKVGAGAITETSNAHAATVATVSSTKVTGSSVGATDGSTINVGTITATDVPGGQISNNLKFTLNAGDVWVAKGTLTAPSGVTVDSGTIAANVLTYAITAGTVPANGTFTLSGATATVNGAGSHKVTITTTAGNTAFGSALQVAFVAAATRTGGADRYATAALIYSQKYSAATSAVIASGANFPDALSATALARAKSTGVLLTDPNNLSGSTKQSLITGGPVTTVYIVGGPAAVSDNVLNQIGALKNSAGNAINVIRVFGADRYATNAAVDLQAGVNGAIGGGTAIVATGQNFADALAVGPAIYSTGWPLILTPSADLNATAKSTIAALGITNAIIVGGTSAVSATAEASLKTAGVTVTNRLAGATRTLTAAEIAKWELTATGTTFAESGYTGNKGLGFSGALVHIARGDNYPDALASGAWLGNAAVLEVLLLTDSPTSLGAGIPAVLKGSIAAYGTANVNAIGLAAALSTPTVNAALGSIS